ALVAYRSQELARRTAKFACAILAGLIGSALLTLLPRVSTVAAEDCLTEPTGDKLDGQHWYYRFDRGSNRRCWYLKDSTSAPKDNAGEAAPRRGTQPASAWDSAQPAPPKLTTRRGPAARASTDAVADDDAKASAKPQSAAATPSLVRAQPATS